MLEMPLGWGWGCWLQCLTMVGVCALLQEVGWGALLVGTGQLGQGEDRLFLLR